MYVYPMHVTVMLALYKCYLYNYYNFTIEWRIRNRIGMEANNGIIQITMELNNEIKDEQAKQD